MFFICYFNRTLNSWVSSWIPLLRAKSMTVILIWEFPPTFLPFPLFPEANLSYSENICRTSNYKLHFSDINECDVYGQCTQLCTNTKGSYKCSCKPGYGLEPDKKTCRSLGNTLQFDTNRKYSKPDRRISWPFSFDKLWHTCTLENETSDKFSTATSKI